MTTPTLSQAQTLTLFMQTKNQELRTAIESFIRNLNSEHTRLAYGRDLIQFSNWLEDTQRVRDISKVTRAEVIRFKDHLAKQGLEHTSIDRKLSTLRSFFYELRCSGIITVDPTEGVKFLNPKRVSRTNDFTDEEVKRVLSKPDQSNLFGIQHYAMMLCLFYCGLRRSELVSLKIGSLCESKGYNVLKFIGKGNSERIVTLPDEVYKAIDEYLILAGREKAKRDEYLFINLRKGTVNQPLEPTTIYKMIVNYARESGIKKKVSPHSCRATAISNARDKKVPDRALQQFAGWTTPAMITKYDKRKTAVEDCASLVISY